MTLFSEGERCCWTYLVNNKLATAAEVAAACNVTEREAQALINRIGTPREVFEAEARELEGKKYDGDKARYDLIPPEVEEAIAKVLSFGAAKYGERNWELGMRWGRPYAALRRHMAAWWGGENTDPETGMSHLWHACACLAFLTAFEARGVGTDDRPSSKAD